MWTPVSSWQFIWEHAPTFMETPVSTEPYIRKTGALIDTRRRVPNVELNGNRRHLIMSMPVSDLINIWQRSCSDFGTSVTYFIRFWEPTYSISWKPFSVTDLTWNPASAKYWTPVSKIVSIWNPASENYCASVCKNILNWKRASKKLWTPFYATWRSQ